MNCAAASTALVQSDRTGPTPFRIAFITDCHIQPERGGAEMVRNFFAFMSEDEQRPDLIVNAGDIVMDAVAADLQRVETLWSLWHEAIEQIGEIPIRYCLGNHDIWGWNKRSGCNGTEPLFGKQMFLSQTGLEKTYYTFDAGGWRFVVLDSLFRLDTISYVAALDAGQNEWLQHVLDDTPSNIPIAVISHIPILGGASVFFATTESAPKGERGVGFVRDWVVPSWQMHSDALHLIELFAEHKNVRLCLSGHTHIYDEVIYRGIHFINGGAVCGQWWRGKFFGTPPGYVALELHSDGSFLSQYVSWENHESLERTRS